MLSVEISAIMPALIGSAAATLGTVLLKENKTSEFRQAWIDGLREDLASILSGSDSLHIIYEMDLGHKDFWREAQVDLRAANAAISRVKLRLNPSEGDGPKELLAALDQLESYYTSSDPVDLKKISGIEGDILFHSRAVLKSEWVRVKRGERIYRMVKWGSLVAFLAFAVLLGYSLLNGDAGALEVKGAQVPNLEGPPA